MKHYIFTLVLLLVTTICQGQDVDIKQQQQLAEQGNEFAQYNLGNCYLYGKGVTQDYSKAEQ